MPSGDLWLHPVHTVASADATVVIPLSMQEKLTDVQKLQHFVSGFAHAHYVGSASSGGDLAKGASLLWKVSLSSIGMMITREGEVGVRSQQTFPLCFCGLAHASVGRQQLIAIGRRDSSTEVGESKEKNRRNFIGPFGQVWVLLVDGDEDVLHSVLSAMSVLGAVRVDFHCKYQLHDSSIGEGCFSTVYLGKPLRRAVKRDLTQTILNETLNEQETEAIAAKVFKRRPGRHESEMAAAEAAHLLTVHTHPNIVSYYGIFAMPPLEVGGQLRWTMVLQWCGGGDLHDYLVRVGAVQETKAAEFLVGLLAALAHIHSCNIVHRDVKAENILLSEDERPMLADFGMASRMDDEYAMTQRCGSPGYAAPEILRGEKYDLKVDVFSAGVVLYFLLYATQPFAGPDIGGVLRRTVTGKIKFPELSGSVGNDMKEVVLQLLQKKPENRIDSKSASCLMFSGWCRNRCLPQWLCNRDHEFVGRRNCESTISLQMEAAARNSLASSKKASSSMYSLAGVGPKTTESFGAVPVEIACREAENIQQESNIINSDSDQQARQRWYSRDTRSRAGTTQTTDRSTWHSDCSGRSIDFDSDILLSDRIPEPPKQTSHHQHEMERRKNMCGIRNRFWRRMRSSVKTGVIDEDDPPAKAFADVAQSMPASHQPSPPQVPKKASVHWHSSRKYASIRCGWQQPGRSIFKPLMPGHNKGPPVRLGEIGQEDAGMHDEQHDSDRERTSDSDCLSATCSREKGNEATSTASKGWCLRFNDESKINLLSRQTSMLREGSSHSDIANL